MAEPPLLPPPAYGQPGPPPQGYYPPPQPGPPYGPPFAPRKKSGSAWIIALFIILGAVTVFGGTLAALAIYGVRKYIANAKTAEARNSVGAMARDAAMAFEREQTSPSGATIHRLCPSASRSVPDSIVKVSAKKYMASTSDWQVDAARHAGFACLRFSLATPQYYMYSYKAHGAGAVGDGFEAIAVGDLNGDGNTSLFKSTGMVTGPGVVSVAPKLFEQDPEE
jgi:type IV pilus assembly protein PilA